jgi:hypothetical protein
VLVLAGCGQGEHQAPAEIAPAPASDLPGTDELAPPDGGGSLGVRTGLALLRRDRPYWAGQDTTSTLQRARVACKALKRGDHPLFGNPDDTDALYAFAIAVYCPREAS